PRLGRDVHAIALATEDLADRRFGLATMVAVGGVEVIDAVIERVTYRILLARAELAPTKRDVGHAKSGAAEHRVAAHLTVGFLRRLCVRSDGQTGHREARQRASLQKLSATESVVSVP